MARRSHWRYPIAEPAIMGVSRLPDGANVEIGSSSIKR